MRQDKTRQDKKRHIRMILNLVNDREAAGILRLESAGSPYGHLAATVQNNIADLSQYIESVKNM